MTESRHYKEIERQQRILETVWEMKLEDVKEELIASQMDPEGMSEDEMRDSLTDARVCE